VHIRTKTDTGRQGEYPKALERTVLKELGNLTPYVRNKGSLQGHLSNYLSAEGAVKWLWRLFTKNTVLC
jgi:hypothetical protein